MLFWGVRWNFHCPAWDVSLPFVQSLHTVYEVWPPPKQELFLGDRLPPLGECSRNLSVSVHQLALLWEAAFKFFWRIFQRVCPFHDGWGMSAPAYTTLLSVQQFLTKNSMTPLPHPAYSPDIAPRDIFVCFPNEKSPQGDMFCWCGRGEPKDSRITKRHQINDLKISFEQWK